MDLKRMRERAHMRRLARRDDAMLGAQEFWDGISYLARELIPYGIHTSRRAALHQYVNCRDPYLRSS